MHSPYPLIDHSLELCGRSWTVRAVQDQDALLDHADEFVNFPFGFLLWESSVALAQYVCAHAELFAGRSVLELGAGVGLPGIVAASVGADVLLTDHQSLALDVARQNAMTNGVSGVRTGVADWTLWPGRERYDVVLGADILYNRAMHFYLEEILGRTVAAGGMAVLTDPGRPQALEFASVLERKGAWEMSLTAMDVERLPHQGRGESVEVGLLILRRNQG